MWATDSSLASRRVRIVPHAKRLPNRASPLGGRGRPCRRAIAGTICEPRRGPGAKSTGRSKTFYVRAAIHEHLGQLEEQFWADFVAQEWEDSGRQSRQAGRPAQELWDELGV